MRFLVRLFVSLVFTSVLGAELSASAPPAVMGLAATTPSPGAVFLTWAPVPGATSYRIYKSHDPLLYMPPPSFAPAILPGHPAVDEVSGTTYPDVQVTPLTRYFYVVTAVNADGESPIHLVGSAVHVRPRAAPDATVSGFVDTHNHQFANLAFGGRVLHGDAFGTDAEHALGLCNVAHGPGGAFDIVGNLLHGRAGHNTSGWNGFSGWPRWNDSTHQQVYVDWLYRAFEGGLRLLVVPAVNNEILCRTDQTVNLLRGAPYSCDDMAAVDRQIDAAFALQAYLDGVYGGTGRGWYRIARSASQARAIINSGKLAVVLGIEVDSLFSCPDQTSCTNEEIVERLQAYHAKGVRHLFPVHLYDNAFGGAAVYNPLFNYANKLSRGQFFTVEECPLIAPGDAYGYTHQVDLVVSFVATLLGLGNPAGTSFSSECNAQGLTSAGETLITAMMDLGMLIDVDHMSVRTTEQVLQLAEARNYSGIVSGHGGVTATSAGQLKSEGGKNPDVIARIGALGGLVSPILAQGERRIAGVRADGVIASLGSTVPNDCSSSSKTFAQAYLDVVRVLGGPAVAAVGLGTDFNGLAGQPGPRFGGEACSGDAGHQVAQSNMVTYPIPIHQTGGGYVGSLSRHEVGVRQFDFNNDGLAHVGLLPDLLQDLKQIGVSDAQLAPLFRSAEQYLRMWELAEVNDIPLPTITLTMENAAPPSGWYTSPQTAIAVGSAGAGGPSVASVELSATGAGALAPVTVAGASASLQVSAEGTTVVSATSRDSLGRVSPTPATATARIDTVPPSVDCGTADAQWHPADVQVACTAGDAGSGLASPADASFALTTAVAASVETSNAFTDSRGVFDVAGLSTVAAPVGGHKIDRKAPAVTVSLPPSPLFVGVHAPVTYQCADGGSGVQSCTGSVPSGASVDTSSVGSQTFVVATSDNVNNAATVSSTYVVSYKVCLLYDPLKSHKSGSTIPIKIRLCDAAGANVSNAATIVHATTLTKVSAAATGVPEDSGNANPDNDFRFTAEFYLFNLKTTGLTQGTWQLRFTVSGDPTEHVVSFQIR